MEEMLKNLEYQIVESEEKLLIQILKKEKSNEEFFIFVDENEKLTLDTAENLVRFYNEISYTYNYRIDNTDINRKYIVIIAQRTDILDST